MKFSILIPVYNVENFLKRCLDSVLNQTLKDIEIVCGEYEKLANLMLEKDEEGKPIIADDNYVIEDAAKWVAAIDELLMAEADVVITTIDLNDLEKCDSPDFDSLSVEELSAIGFMIA